MGISSSVKIFGATSTLMAACMTLYAAYLSYLGAPAAQTDRWAIVPDVGRLDLTFDTQTALSDVGLYSEERDGELNADTVNAILSAERIFGMELTGKPSEGLYQRLFFFGRNRHLIQTIQELFADRGEFESEPNGDLDAQTADMLESAWRAHGLQHWPLLDREVLVALIFNIGADNLESLDFAASGLRPD